MTIEAAKEVVNSLMGEVSTLSNIAVAVCFVSLLQLGKKSNTYTILDLSMGKHVFQLTIGLVMLGIILQLYKIILTLEYLLNSSAGRYLNDVDHEQRRQIRFIVTNNVSLLNPFFRLGNDDSFYGSFKNGIIGLGLPFILAFPLMVQMLVTSNNIPTYSLKKRLELMDMPIILIAGTVLSFGQYILTYPIDKCLTILKIPHGNSVIFIGLSGLGFYALSIVVVMFRIYFRRNLETEAPTEDPA